MKRWLADIWRFAFRRTSHPVYRRELAGWSYIRLWRSLRSGCAPLSALAVGLMTLVCGGMCLLMLMPAALESEIWAIVPFAVLVGLLVSERIFRFANGLVATVLGATAISAELEADTYALLRLTLIPPREIVAAKFGAVIAQVRTPTLLLSLVRILIIAIVVITLTSFVINALAQSSPMPQSPPPPVAPSPASSGPSLSPFQIALLALLYSVAILLLILTGLLWLVYYVALPVLEAFWFASLGLFASSLVRTRGSGLLAAGGMRLIVWIGSYVAGQFFSAFTFLGLPLAFLPDMPPWLEPMLSQPAVFLIFIALVALVMLVIVVGVQIGVVIGLLSWTSRRASRLPFGYL